MNPNSRTTNRVIYAALGNFAISIAFQTFNLAELIDLKIIFDQNSKNCKDYHFSKPGTDLTVFFRINPCRMGHAGKVTN